KLFQPLTMLSYNTEGSFLSGFVMYIAPKPFYTNFSGLKNLKPKHTDVYEGKTVLVEDATTILDFVTNSEDDNIDYFNVKLWEDPISMPTFIRVKVPFTYNTSSRESKSIGSNICPEDNIIGYRAVFRYRKQLPIKYSLLEFVVKDPKPVLKRLKELNMSAYVLPVLCLKSALSKVIKYWMRTYTDFIDNNSRCCISTSAICLDLILDFYGFAKNQKNKYSFLTIETITPYDSTKSMLHLFSVPPPSEISDTPEHPFEESDLTSTEKQSYTKQKREKFVEKPYQTRYFHGKSKNIKLRTNKTYTRMRLRI
ncbi:hypothetical protein RFI_13777, partial [Reticulomyxa filosa]